MFAPPKAAICTIPVLLFAPNVSLCDRALLSVKLWYISINITIGFIVASFYLAVQDSGVMALVLGNVTSRMIAAS